jgi:hypothetical protein
MKPKPIAGKRLKTQERRRTRKRTHYLWWDEGESIETVRERFAQMVEEGTAGENDDYVIFHWKWTGT